MKRVSFHEPTEFELNDAVVFFESKTAGLGTRFLTAVEKAVAQIERHPQASPIIRHDVRRKLLWQVSLQHPVHYQTRPHPHPRDCKSKAQAVLLEGTEVSVNQRLCTSLPSKSQHLQLGSTRLGRDSLWEFSTL